MRGCVKFDYLIRTLALLLLCWHAPVVQAEGISILKAEARLTAEGYVLSADYDITLPAEVEQALQRGVTLYFASELSVHRSRWYWLDTEIASHEQISKLSYNALTRQYRVSRGGLFQSFFDLKTALKSVGHQTAPPIPASLMDNSGGNYLTRLARKDSRIGAYAAMRLDLSQLPKPLQVNALTDDRWAIGSARFHWDITPAPAEEKDDR